MINEEDIKEVKKLLEVFNTQTNNHFVITTLTHDIILKRLELRFKTHTAIIFIRVAELREYLNNLTQEYKRESWRRDIDASTSERYTAILLKHVEDRKTNSQVPDSDMCTFRLMLDNHLFIYLGAVKYSEFTDEFSISIKDLVLALHTKGKEVLGVNTNHGTLFSSIKTCGSCYLRNKNISILDKEVTEYLTKLKKHCESISYLSA